MDTYGNVFGEIERRRVEDLGKITRAVQRIQALEDRLEGQEALTASLEEKVKNLEDAVKYLRGLAM